MIATSCEACVFATWQGNEQKGCKLNRIAKLVENGATLDKITEGDKTHFLILNRWCNKCRNKEWGDQHPKRKWAEVAAQEVQFKYDVIIYCDGNSTFEDIEESLTSLNLQIHKANKVVFVVDFDFNDCSIDEVISLVKDSATSKWNVIGLKQDSSDPLDEAVKSTEGFYYCLFGAGAPIPVDFLSKIESAINEDMIQISAIEPDSSNNGMVIQKLLHEKLAGNVGGFILEKIRYLCNEQGYDQMIRKFEEL